MDVSTGKYEYNRRNDHRAILEEFRRNVGDILEPRHDDLYLMRFLKARDFDLVKAEKMIRETFKFRAKIKADSLLTGDYEVPEVYLKHHVTFTLGFDNENHPVRVIMIGLSDCKGLLSSLSNLGLLKLSVYVLESDLQMIRDRKKKVPIFDEKTTYIIDFRNFSLKQFYDKAVITFALHLLSTYQDHYPETLNAAYVINAPSYFNWLYNIFKPVLNSVTQNKIRIYKDDYKEHLRSIMDPQILPAFMGGDLTDPDGDPNCPSLVNWNPKIDPSYYMKQNGQKRESEDNSLKKSTIQPRSNLQVPVEVKIAGSILKWNFWTKDYNIKFGLFFKGDNSNMEEMLAVEGVDCQIIPEENEFICNKIGTYVLHFDNTYSWLTSKQIWYNVEVIDVIPSQKC